MDKVSFRTDLRSPSIKSFFLLSFFFFKHRKWKRKSFVTVGKTWLIIKWKEPSKAWSQRDEVLFHFILSAEGLSCRRLRFPLESAFSHSCVRVINYWHGPQGLHHANMLAHKRTFHFQSKRKKEVIKRSSGTICLIIIFFFLLFVIENAFRRII